MIYMTTVVTTSDTTTSTSQAQPEIVPSLLSPLSPSSPEQQFDNFGPQSIIPETPDVGNMQQLSDLELLRRHSLSLRSPPAGSLAGDILGTTDPAQHYYTKTKNILSNLKEMTERFSDFGSCQSDSSSAEDDTGGYTKQGKKKRKQRQSITPDRDFFMKKPNLAVSPQL